MCTWSRCAPFFDTSIAIKTLETKPAAQKIPRMTTVKLRILSQKWQHTWCQWRSSYAHHGGTAPTNAQHTARTGHPLKALIKEEAKSQVLKVVWQGHSFKAVIEIRTKSQVLKVVWQGHSFKALIKAPAKSQLSKAARQGHSFKALIELLS